MALPVVRNATTENRNQGCAQLIPVVRLEKLDLSKFNVGPNGISVLLPKTKSVDKSNEIVHLDKGGLLELMLSEGGPKPKESLKVTSSDNIPTLSCCEDCYKSIDTIFEKERKMYIQPYEMLVQKQAEKNETLSKELADLERRWCAELEDWGRVADELDETMDKWKNVVEKNHDLRLRTNNYFASVIAPEHNYA